MTSWGRRLAAVVAAAVTVSPGVPVPAHADPGVARDAVPIPADRRALVVLKGT